MSARYSICTGKVASGALAAAATKSLWLLNPATDGLALIEAWITFGSTAAQTDVAAELYRTTTVGSPAGTTGTIVKEDPNTASSTVSALTALTTEPTAIEKLREGYVTTQNGLLVVYFPLGREPVGAAAGNRIGCRLVNDGGSAMSSVDCRATAVYEEQ